MNTKTAVILAAGQSRRMKSKTAKMIHPVGGGPMITYPIEKVRGMGIKRIIVVVGAQADPIREILSSYGVDIVEQDKPLGTADAVMRTRDILEGSSGPILIMNGDTPLITESILSRLVSVHQDEKADLTLLTASIAKPRGYGRVIRSQSDQVERVVEERDASPAELRISEINTGFYVAETGFLFEALQAVKKDNKQGEFYLTDLVELAVTRRLKVADVVLRDSCEDILGINSRLELAEAENRMRWRIVKQHLTNGVTLKDPSSTWIDYGVRIGRDTVIYPHVQIEGNTEIGEDCSVRSFCRIVDSRIGSGVEVRESCVLHDARLEDKATIGPFSHLRPGSVIGKNARVGNFVETKKTELGEGSKANHLSYLGDSVIGKGVNIGAGTITCNYDGVNKLKTVIGDGVFVGSDTQFVAPVRIGPNAVIGAGSTITEDVPEDALALSRSPQVTKSGWARKKKEGRKKKGNR